MAYTNVPKTIQINEFTNPFTVIKTIYKKECCSAYLVSWSTSDSQEKTGIMQVFPPEYATVYHRAKDALMRVFGRNRVTPFSGTDAAEYLLIDLSTGFLQWKTILNQSIQERLKILLKLGKYLSKLENQGIVPNGIDIRTIIQQPDGNLCSWDFQNAIIIEDAADKDVKHNRRQCVLDLTQLTIQALVGKIVPGANCLALLKLALYGRMTVSDQEEFLEFLDKYLHDEDRAELPPLLDAIELTKMSLEDYTPIVTRNRETSLAVANFLQKNPLWQYVKEGCDGYKHLNILMIGVSPMRKAFLDAIIPCAQMLDTRMHIRVVAKDAVAFCDRYLKNAPLLAQTVQITHIPERPKRSYALNEALTGKDLQGNAEPLAYLTFENVSRPDAAILQSFDAGCILLMESPTEQLRQALLALIATQRRPFLIGVNAPVPQLENPKKLNSRVVLDSFARTPGSLTKTVIYRKALAVHTFYEKEYNERISQAEILKTFDKPYNRDSSIRSALSIPYKLAAYGLAGCENASGRFYYDVLQNEQRVRRLIWLEHRSWQAFLITRGWTLDTEHLENDFAAHNHNHKDEDNLWHACLFGSHDTRLEPLAGWTPEEWEEKNPSELDPLDKMSVVFHRLYAKYVAEKVDPALEASLEKLESQVPPIEWQQIKDAVSALRANVTNADVGWERVLKDLRNRLARENPGNTNKVKKNLEDIDSKIRFIQKRNSYQQYKNVDRAILEAIPYLLEKESISCVYKLWSDHGHPWNNMASAFFLEPKHVCFLIAEGQKTPDCQAEKSFLCNRRHIETSVKVMPLEDLKRISKHSVLDVTGVDIQQFMTATKHFDKLTENIRIVHYKDGKLQDLDGKSLLCPQNQTLTVEELMAVTGTEVLSEHKVVPMQHMTRCEDLWKMGQTMKQYNTVCDFFAANKQVGKVRPIPRSNNDTLWSRKLKATDKYELQALLDPLMKASVIKPIQWDRTPEVIATDRRYQKTLNKMLSTYIKASDNARENLTLSFKSDDPEALCVLENTSLTFNRTCSLQKIDSELKVRFDSNGDRWLPLDELSDSLKKLQEHGFILQTNNKPFLQETTMTETRKDGSEYTVPAVHIRFHYADLPTMDCLTKAGNALEALAYHTIRRMDIFDDVKLGVTILWGEQGTPTQNEIDLVCTKGTNSYFISCKKRAQLRPEHITEIRYETDRFGFDGTAILLTTAREEDNTAAYARARHMGVEIITLKDKSEENSAKVLQTKIEEIVNKTGKNF